MILKLIACLLLSVFIQINREFIVETLFEDSLKSNLIILNQDNGFLLKQRKIILQLFPLLLTLPKIYAVIYASLLLFIYFKPYFKTKTEMKNLQDQLHYEFPIWIRSIQCYLQSSNVVVSIEKSYQYAPQLLKYHLKDLIWKLSCEPTNIEHYESFMSDYDNYEIEKMMKFLYRFNHMDASQGEKHLDRMIESTGLWMNQTRLGKQEQKVSQFSIYGILPVVVVSIYFLILMSLVIVTMMEGGWIL